MLDAEVLVLEFLAVDGSSTRTVTIGEVSALDHELGDDSVEARAFIAIAFLTGGKLVEVVGGVWDLPAIEAHDDAAERLSTLLDVEVDLLGDCGVSHVDGWNVVGLSGVR